MKLSGYRTDGGDLAYALYSEKHQAVIAVVWSEHFNPADPTHRVRPKGGRYWRFGPRHGEVWDLSKHPSRSAAATAAEKYYEVNHQTEVDRMPVRYRPIAIYEPVMPHLVTCEECGASVSDEAAHTAYHKSLDDLAGFMRAHFHIATSGSAQQGDLGVQVHAGRGEK